MDKCVERLLNSGFTLENATQICKCYMHRCDEDGLESFICSCEQYDPLKIKAGDSIGV